MAFIIGTYNKYDVWDREHSVYKFEINGNWYAIKEVKMEWGLPQIGLRVDMDERPDYYRIYEKYEDAFQFAVKMKQIAR